MMKRTLKDADLVVPLERHRGSRKDFHMENDEFVAEWDVARDDDGNPITISVEQVYAIWQAIHVVEAVREKESYESLWTNPHPNLYKSRLLGRMLIQGRPPTRTRPPVLGGGPDWSGLPGGDPFDD